MQHPLLDTDNGNILIVNPQLAAWIGLNEAIFLRQLHFILTRKNDVGKWADSKKWYRDKPHDFVVKYFPFWDEGVVKRTINNLRNDGLLLARSDLNQQPKDRSLWYTVNYDALNRVEGPVYRLIKKSNTRREARIARDENEPTEVQNVLLTEDDEIGTKVQNVPDQNEPTEVQNVLLTSVQNVPTPKDSLPKDSNNNYLNAPACNTPMREENPEPETPIPKLDPIPGLIDHFVEVSCLDPPFGEAPRRVWGQALQGYLEKTGGDVARCRELITESVETLGNAYTIIDPFSIEKTLNGILAQAKRAEPKRNGAHQNGRSSGKFEPNARRSLEGASEDTKRVAAAFRARSRANRPPD